MRDPCASAMEMYSQVASSATKAVATTTSKKDPLQQEQQNQGDEDGRRDDPFHDFQQAYTTCYNLA